MENEAGKPDLTAVVAKIDQLETEVKAHVQVHKQMNGKWDRHTEKIMDKLVLLGTWVHDMMHNCTADPDEMDAAYRRSMQRRVRRALRYEF